MSTCLQSQPGNFSRSRTAGPLAVQLAKRRSSVRKYPTPHACSHGSYSIIEKGPIDTVARLRQSLEDLGSASSGFGSGCVARAEFEFGRWDGDLGFARLWCRLDDVGGGKIRDEGEKDTYCGFVLEGLERFSRFYCGMTCVLPANNSIQCSFSLKRVGFLNTVYSVHLTEV